jgi:DNA-binding NtrC family response regulator
MSRRILVVDDDSDIRDTLLTVLGGVGYDVALAADAAEARRQLDEEPVDLVITDCMMPGESGKELADHVATERGLPVVFLTGDPSMYFELKRAPFIRLGKPFRTVNLLQVVDQEIRAAERKRAIQAAARPAPAHLAV